tara:strand:- start:1414 stop:2409 length:996 start_codon:yes stop_codon:yes gene_type:complete
MSDIDSLSPEEPFITDTGIVIDAFPAAVDVETSKERDIERMADPRLQGDFPDPSPVASRTPKKTDEEKWDDYLEKYDRLNKLKNKLNKKIEDIKKKFKKANPDASIDEKKTNLNKKKKQLDSLINEIDVLEKSIDKPTIIDMPKQLDDIRKEINLQKRIITEYKLDLLFDLDDEEVILTEFQSNKENLEKLLEYASQLKEIYDKKTKMTEIIQYNPDTGEKIDDDFKKVFVSRKDELHKKHKKLNQLVSDFKKNIKQYQQSGEKSLLTDSLEIYKNVIMPLLIEIRSLKYQVIYVDKISQSNNGKINKKEMPIYHFIPRQVNLENEQYYDI